MNNKPPRPRPSQWFWCQECGRQGDINDMFESGNDCCIATVIDDLER